MHTILLLSAFFIFLGLLERNHFPITLSEYLTWIRRTARDEYSVGQDARLWELTHTSQQRAQHGNFSTCPDISRKSVKTRRFAWRVCTSASPPNAPTLSNSVVCWLDFTVNSSWAAGIVKAEVHVRSTFPSEVDQSREKSITSVCAERAARHQHRSTLGKSPQLKL